jgi:hypothetical protein
MINVCGYYDGIIDFLEHSVSQQFIKWAHREMILIDNHPDGLREPD